MPAYQIESTAGVVLGTYEGATEQDARDAMAREAGYADEADCIARTASRRDDLIVRKL